jgi:hypothetical protein
MILVGTLLLALLIVLSLTVGRGIDAHRLTPQDRGPALANLIVPLLLLGCAGWIMLEAEPASPEAGAFLVLVGLAVSATVGNPVTGAVLALADPRSRRDQAQAPDPANPDPANPDPANPDPANRRRLEALLTQPGGLDPSNPGPAGPATTGPADPALLRGGAWIGALERLVVTAGLLTGWGEAVLLIVAIKGLGRYPEMRSPASAERFIIGTIASLLWAGAVAEVILLGLH